jgi:bacterioferritin-associated ferredoxin
VIVCHCQAVNDRAVRCAVRDGARTRRAVAETCRAGKGCGGCALLVDEIILSEERRAAPRFAVLRQIAATG